MLPKSGKKIQDIETLVKVGYLADLHAKAELKPVVVSLPKFRINYNFNAKDILIKMGVSDLFTPKANLSMISDTPGLSISDMLSVTFLSKYLLRTS